MTKALLQMNDVVAGYEKGLPIVRGVSFTASGGEIVAIFGPNGAGKSTFIKAAAGLMPVSNGSMLLNGRDITQMPAHLRARAGLAYVPQLHNVFATLTVLDHLKIGAALLPPEARTAQIDASLTLFPDLARQRQTLAGRLSGGQRQLLSIARAIGAGILVTPDQLLLVAITATLVGLLYVMWAHTALGRAMRAVSENPALAQVCGIDVPRVVRVTWYIGGALASAAGLMLGLLVQVRPQMGFEMLLPLFAAAILGGIGSVPGALCGGLIVGLSQAATVQFIGAEWRAGVAFVILLAVLLIRPNGLFGRRS